MICVLMTNVPHSEREKESTVMNTMRKKSKKTGAAQYKYKISVIIFIIIVVLNYQYRVD